MVKELAIKSRSYRGYNEKRHITKEELLYFVDIARYCPSSINMQPFCYYLACEKDDLDRVFPLTKWARALPDMELPHKGMHPTGYIVVCQDTNIFESTQRFQKDVGIVSQTILLAATEKGLGGCMIANFNPEEVKEVLKLSDNLFPLMIIALGEPNEKIVIKEISPGEDHNYYRDENDVHYVPKRRLSDIIIEH